MNTLMTVPRSIQALIFGFLVLCGVDVASAADLSGKASGRDAVSTSALIAAIMAKDEGAVIRQIEAGVPIAVFVSEREVRQLAEPHKHISYLGDLKKDYPLVVLLAVADMPKAIAAIEKRAPGLLHEQDPYGNTALSWAARLERLDTAKELLKHGLSPTQANKESFLQSPLGLIVMSRETSDRKTEMVRLLVGAVSRDQIHTIHMVHYLWEAAYAWDFKVMKVLLDAGVSPRYVAREGRTALFSAVEAGNLDAVKLLLAHGARTSTVPYRGKTIFEMAHECAQQGTTDAVEIDRLLNIEKRKLITAGRNPSCSFPADWIDKSGEAVWCQEIKINENHIKSVGAE